MSKLTFYVQQRVDGGRRAGIDVDGETVFDQFETGGDEFDPALEWYVDIRCAGELPSDPEGARQWLLGQRELLTSELRNLSDRLQVGLDAGLWPRQHRVGAAPQGVEIVIVCSSLRDVATRDFGRIVGRLAEDLPAIVTSLGRVEAVSQ